ncbi:MAG: nitroreductase family protein [Lachnospiraceae bacterium]|nr:nitroreductase family protein [Lachnospiraceae bacterium]
MEVKECLKTRRSVRQFTDREVDPQLIEDIIDTVSYSPSWKNTQITRYAAVTGELKDRIAAECTGQYSHNGDIIRSAPVLMVQYFITKRSGFERDGSYSTKKEGAWQMYDAGISAGAFCSAAYDAGLATVILGIFDYDKTAELLGLDETKEVAVLIPLGYGAETPAVPRKKGVSDLLTFLS